MNRAAVATDPLPDPKTLSTFWAADHTAIGTGLGCVAFVHLCEGHPCVIAFISELPTARPPTRSGMKHLLDCWRVVGTEVGFSLVRRSPFLSWTRRSPEHPRLSPRVVIGPGARFVEFSLLGPHAGGVLGGSDASV